MAGSGRQWRCLAWWCVLQQLHLGGVVAWAAAGQGGRRLLACRHEGLGAVGEKAASSGSQAQVPGIRILCSCKCQCHVPGPGKVAAAKRARDASGVCQVVG